MVLRKVMPALVLAAVAVLAAIVARPAAVAALPLANTTRIPALNGITFAGARVSLPEAFEGKLGVLVIGFSRGSQESARGWGERLAQRYPDGSEVVFYEMPVLAGVPAPLRGWVLRRIRQSVSAPAREHFLPVLDHAEEWKQAAGGNAANDTSVLLVDARGEVRWRARGPVSDAAFAELERQVDMVQR